MFFFKEKNQETFALPLGPESGRPWPENKSLLLLFFRKEGLTSFQPGQV
jgi:hypothetical protein